MSERLAEAAGFTVGVVVTAAALAYLAIHLYRDGGHLRLVRLP